MTLPTHIVATGGLVINQNDDVLLVNNPNKGWEFPGGIVEPGETIPQALIREIKEESGVTAEIADIVGIYSNVRPRKGYNGVDVIPTIVNVDFICRYVSGEPATSPESIGVGWFSKAESVRKVNPRQQIRLNKMIRHHNEFTCMGFSLDDTFHMRVQEEYIF